MKVIGITSAAVLLLLLSIAAPAYAQQDQQGEKQREPEKQAQPENKQQPPKAEQRQQEQNKQQEQHAQQQQQGQNKQQEQHAQQQQQEQNKQQEQHAQQQQQEQNKQQEQHAQQQRQEQQNQNKQQEQHAQQQRGNEHPQRSQEQQRVQRSAWQEHRSQHWDSDHRNWQQRGGYNGYRIPDDRFRGDFGRDHGFRINGLPFMVVEGYPRFQYSGYWFSLVDPWPEYWGDDWYDNDDVYVVYMDNGYYLFNNRYPNVGIAISITM